MSEQFEVESDGPSDHLEITFAGKDGVVRVRGYRGDGEVNQVHLEPLSRQRESHLRNTRPNVNFENFVWAVKWWRVWAIHTF